MPLDVIMPALGMAQETGVIVAWHKKPGDPVAEGDVLFEVETDKATMEVEAQGAGFLTSVSASEGEEVPVGGVIARISDSADDEASTPPGPKPAATAAEGSEADDLPDGHGVIMPTLGMAQDTGLLVGWLVEPGTKLGPDDPLFEVETDKSTMEVPAGAEGYLAACLAAPGEDVPTGQVIAILTQSPPEKTISRSAGESTAPAAPAEEKQPEAAAKATPPAPSDQSPASPPPASKAMPTDPSGRILASPKLRRLALEQGLDLSRLAAAGISQPYHVRDLETLKSLPADAAAQAATATGGSMHITAELDTEGFTDFARWAAQQADMPDAHAVLAGLAGASMGLDRAVVAHEAFGKRRLFDVPRGNLGGVTEVEDTAPNLILRDLRTTRVTGLCLGAEACPVLTLTANGEGLALTLECTPGQLAPDAALSLLADFAGRLEQPLRHLL